MIVSLLKVTYFQTSGAPAIKYRTPPAPGCILFAYDEPFSSINDSNIKINRKRIFLINNNQKIVRTWTSNVPVTKAILTETGDVWALAGLAWDQTSKPVLLHYSWSGELIEEIEVPRAHHDFFLAPPNRVFFLAEREISSDKLPEEFRKRSYWISDEIVEFDLKKKSVVRNIPYELYFPVEEPGRANEDEGRLFHGNSLFFVESNSFTQSPALLVSSRNTSQIAMIDLDSEKLLYLSEKGMLDGQHCLSQLASGNILVFDNGAKRGFSMLKEINPQSNKIVWEWKTKYKHDFFNRVEGCVQRLPNGNSLVTYSMAGLIFEIDGAGSPSFHFLGGPKPLRSDYFFPFYPIYQSKKYSNEEVPFRKLGVNCQ